MIAARSKHTAAGTSSGRAICWGDDEYGKLSCIPELKPDVSFVILAVCHGHMAAVTSSGRKLLSLSSFGLLMVCNL